MNYVRNKLKNTKYFCGPNLVYLMKRYIGTTEAGIQQEMKQLC